MLCLWSAGIRVRAVFSPPLAFDRGGEGNRPASFIASSQVRRPAISERLNDRLDCWIACFSDSRQFSPCHTMYIVPCPVQDLASSSPWDATARKRRAAPMSPASTRRTNSGSRAALLSSTRASCRQLQHPGTTQGMIVSSARPVGLAKRTTARRRWTAPTTRGGRGNKPCPRTIRLRNGGEEEAWGKRLRC